MVRLGYWADVDGQVQLFIYDESGKEVERIRDLPQEVGYNEVLWDSGEKITPGIYTALVFNRDDYRPIAKGLFVKSY